MKQMLRCQIKYNKPVADNIFLLGVKAGQKLKPVPGQFFMVRVRDGDHPLLNRPLDWFRYFPQKGLLEFVYQVVGTGTEILSRRRPGEELTIIGPLGHGFDLKNFTGSALLIAGGVGMPGLWDFCLQHSRKRSCQLTLIWGAKSRKNFFLLDQLPKGIEFLPVTEDGSFGKKGLATEAADKFIQSRGAPNQILACGPRPMLKATAAIAHGYGVRGQALYTEIMGCGTGACLGCAVPAAGGGYLHACSDEPAFFFDQIDWEKVRW